MSAYKRLFLVLELNLRSVKISFNLLALDKYLNAPRSRQFKSLRPESTRPVRSAYLVSFGWTFSIVFFGSQSQSSPITTWVEIRLKGIRRTDRRPTYFAEIVVLKEFRRGPSLLRVVEQTALNEIDAFFGQRRRDLGRLAHPHFEHYLEVRVELVPRALREI